MRCSPRRTGPRLFKADALFLLDDALPDPYRPTTSPLPRALATSSPPTPPMTRSRLAPIYACVCLLAGARPATSQTPTAIERRVNALLSRMTLEEKVGQMTQLALQSVPSVAGTPTVRVQLDSAKLENA